MRLKEIKPGMVIHCKNDEEKKALLEEAERLGYRWIDTNALPTDKTVCSGMTIHFHEPCLIAWSYRWSDNKKIVTEFSDLILQELTAEEAIKWMQNVRDDAVVTLDHIAKEEPNVSPMLYAGRKEKAEIIINGFEELEQYRAIGTVEECRASVEKQTEKKVFVVVQGNYALSKNMDAFSTRELAEWFRKHIRKESDYDGCINIFELEVDGAVLKEEDM